MMMTDYDGADVFDADDDKIGHVERTYVDDTRTSKYIEVKVGALFAKHRLVPLDDTKVQNDGLHLPFSKSLVEGSPDVSGIGDGVDDDVLGRVEAYYSAAPTADANEAGAARTVQQSDANAEDNDDSDGESLGDRIAGSFNRVEAKIAGSGGAERDVPAD